MVVDTLTGLLLNPVIEFLKTQALEVVAKKVGEETASLAWNQVFDSLQKQSDQILAGVEALRQKDVKAALDHYEVAVQLKSMRDENMKSAYDCAMAGRHTIEDPVLKIQCYSVLLVSGIYLHSTKKMGGGDVSEEKSDENDSDSQTDFIKVVIDWMKNDVKLRKAIKKAVEKKFMLKDNQKLLLVEVFTFRKQIVEICNAGNIFDMQILMFLAIQTDPDNLYIFLTPPDILDQSTGHVEFSADPFKSENRFKVAASALNILRDPENESQPPQIGHIFVESPQFSHHGVLQKVYLTRRRVGFTPVGDEDGYVCFFDCFLTKKTITEFSRKKRGLWIPDLYHSE